MNRACIGAFACFVLSACVGAEPPAPTVAWAVPSETGIGVAGTGLEIGFGRHIDGAVSAVSRLSGQAPVYSGPGCKAGVTTVSWPDGLRLHFRGESLVGWEAPQSATLWAAPPARSGSGEVCAPS